MNKKIDVSVVVPTYNEAKNLPLLVRRLARAFRGRKWEVVVVDDGSPDGTGRVAEALAGRYPLRLVQRGRKGGLASAVVEGWRHARGGILVVMDADLQHPPELAPELVRCIEGGEEMAIASRSRWEGCRGATSRVASAFVRVLLVPGVEDPHAGFFAIRREMLQGVKLRPRGYKILLECLARTKCPSIVEVSYSPGKRRWGKSKWGWREGVEYLVQFFSLLRSRRPSFRLKIYG